MAGEDGTEIDLLPIEADAAACGHGDGSVVERIGRSQASAFPVVVADMENLKSTLRAGAEPWSDAAAREVAVAINATADRIRALRDGSDKLSKE